MKLGERLSTRPAVASPALFGSMQRWVRGRLEIMSLLGGVLIWEMAGRELGFPWLPPFSVVMDKLIELFATGQIVGHLTNSLVNLAIGVAIALGMGLPVGALMGRFKRVDQALSAYVYAFFVAPAIVFVPVFFAIFGLARGSIVAIVFMYTVFIVIIDTKTAVSSVDRSLTEMARSYGAGEAVIFFRIIVPAALPLVFAGIQLGVGRGVKGMINGEMFIALVGLGAVSQRFSGRFEAEGALAVALVILGVALILNFVIRGVDNRLNRWSYL